MPHRKSPGNPGFFGVQEAKQRALRLCSNDRHGVTCFGRMPKTLPAASLRFLGSEPAWLTNSESGQKKNKIFFEKGHDENHGPFSFSRERFRRYAECQSLQKARQTGPTKVVVPPGQRYNIDVM